MGNSIGVRMRWIVLLGALGLAAGFGAVGSSAGTATVAATVRPASAVQKWIRVSVGGGDSLDLFSVQGVDFAIAEVQSVRASGVPAPACTVAGTPATLTCVGHVRSGASVFVNVTTTGAGGTFLFGRASGGSQIDLTTAQPQQQAKALLPAAARMTKSDGTKSLIFGGQTTFAAVEILPTSAFRIGSVTAVSVAGKPQPLRACRHVGDGLKCTVTVPTGSLGRITFTAPRTNARTISGLPGPRDSVEVVLHTDGQTADRHVLETAG